MTNREMQNIEGASALSRQLAKQKLRCAVAMVLSAALAFVVTGVVAPGIDALGLAIGAATGLSVGVWGDPNSYRGRNGSMALALVLLAGMWVVPAVVVLISIFD